MADSPDSEPATARHAALPAGVRSGNDVLWQQIDGLVVLMELNAGRYFTLDDVGSRIWEVLVQCTDLPTAMEQLIDLYDVERSVLERDVTALIDQLLAARLLEPVS